MVSSRPVFAAGLPVALAAVATALAAAVAFALAPAGGGFEAFDFTVTRFDDPPPDDCKPDDCSLREAILAANSQFEPQTIKLPAGTYTLTRAGAGESQGFFGDLDIDFDLGIIGDGSNVTIIDGGGLDRIFDLTVFTTPGLISGVTLRNGRVAGEDGGAVRNRGTLTLEDVVIVDSEVLNGGRGGAIADFERVTLRDSTIMGNSASGAGGGLYIARKGTINNSTISDNEGASGGGIYFAGNDALAVNNSTISGNRATATGGGINHAGSGVGTLASSTVTSNRADSDGNGSGSGGGVAGSVSLKNTVLYGNTDPNGDPECSGVLNSLGYNVIPAPSAGCVLVGDATGNVSSEPLLGPLADNGGPTWTHALLPGSPAIDAGNPLGCTGATDLPLAADQRGGARSVGGRCDIGAYEFGAAPPTPTPGPTAPPTAFPTSTPSPTPELSPTLSPSPAATTPPPATPTHLVCFGPAGTVEDGVGIVRALLSSDGEPLAGQEVLWSDEPGLFSVAAASSVTNEDGLASVNYLVPAGAGLSGRETVTSTFLGSEQFGASSCEVSFDVSSSASPSPVRTPAPVLQGDVDCNGGVDAGDALFVLRDTAALTHEAACMENAGDTNCDGALDVVDALSILRFAAALPPLPAAPGCPEIGSPV